MECPIAPGSTRVARKPGGASNGAADRAESEEMAGEGVEKGAECVGRCTLLLL